VRSPGPTEFGTGQAAVILCGWEGNLALYWPCGLSTSMLNGQRKGHEHTVYVLDGTQPGLPLYFYTIMYITQYLLRALLRLKGNYHELEIRSVERGICPTAMLYSLAAAYKGGR